MGNEKWERRKWGNGTAKRKWRVSLVSRSQTLAGLRETTSQCKGEQWGVHVVQGS